MPEFELYSKLDDAELKIKRNGTNDLVHIKRPNYRDELLVSWGGSHYKILRSGIIVRQALIYKDNDYIGQVREAIGFYTKFDIYAHAKKMFSISERERITSQEFSVEKNGKEIGQIKPIGVYIPILSSMGKGYNGSYHNVTKEEEELLLLSILAVGV